MTDPIYDEVLNFAIEKEAEEAAMYASMARSAEHENVKKMLLLMSEEETKHLDLLRKVQENGIGAYKFEEVVDLKISEYLNDIKFTEDMDYRDFLVFAMKNEENALKLYKSWSQSCIDEELCNLFKMLIQEEEKHKLVLEKEYQDLVLSED